MKETERHVISEGFKARIATIEDVRRSFEDNYSGAGICILLDDESDSLIHENWYTLEQCEKLANGCLFFFDENLIDTEEKVQ